VLEAAPAIAELLASCPELRILATSRAALFLRGEHEIEVVPLSVPNLDRLPSPAALGRYEAVALFLQTVRANKPDFSLDAERARQIADICVRLDGLPLAIELAAARLRGLPLDRLHAQLGRRLDLLTSGPRDLPERQRTLRDTIAWSHDLLALGEQVVFRRLAVFAGGAELEAVAAVAGAGGQQALAGLAEKNLVRLDDDARRMTMLETIREYGLEKLEGSGEADEIGRQHAAHYSALARRAATALRGPDQDAWLDRLDDERDNLRLAVQWLIDRDETEPALQVGADLWRYWWNRGRHHEWLAVLDRALALPDQQPSRGRAAALEASGRLVIELGDLATGQRRFEASLACSEAIGDRRGVAIALNALGQVAFRRGEYDKGIRHDTDALAIHREIENVTGITVSLNGLAMTAAMQGRLEAAKDLFAEAAANCDRSGDLLQKIWLLNNLGNLAMLLGNLDEARRWSDECLALSRRLQDRRGVMFALLNLGMILLHDPETDPADVLRRGREAREAAVELDDPLIAGDASRVIGQAERRRGRLPESATAFADAFRFLDRTEAPTSVVSAWEDVAHLAVASGNGSLAARLLGAAATQREAIGYPVEALDRESYDRLVAEVSDALGFGDYERAWNRGGRLTPAEATAEARAYCDHLIAQPLAAHAS
jgi:predicted ATPase